MNPQLKLFTNPDVFRGVRRGIFSNFIEPFRSSLPPVAAALLEIHDFETHCAVWPVQFRSLDGLGAPLIEALVAVETLALPENAHLIEEARSLLPPGFEIPRTRPLLDQALHLWVITRNHPEVPWPLAAQPSAAPPVPAAAENLVQLSPPEITGGTSSCESPSSTSNCQPSTEMSASPPAPAPNTETTPAETKHPLEPSTFNLQPSTNIAALNLRLSVLFFEIDPLLRHEFFTHFEPELREAFPELPKISVGNDDFDIAVYQLLNKPAFLPETMRQALLAIQDLAQPANRQLLRLLVNHASVHGETSATAEHYAVAYWLRRPFPPGGIEALRASLPPHLLHPPPPPSDNGHVQAPTSGPPLFDPSPVPQPPPSRPADLAVIARFPRNIISRLPADVRDELNQFLRQRVTYLQIVSRLAERAPGLNKSNLSRWKKTGHKLWLAEQQRREDAQAQIQLLFDVVREDDNAKLHEATQQIAALRISQVLAAFDPATLTQAFLDQPQAFVRLIQTLPNLSRGGIDCERLRAETADRASASDPNKNPGRGIPDDHLQYFTQKLNLM